MPKRYYARHFCSGIAGYLDENFLVPLDAMKDMNSTFEGKPIFVGHQNDSAEKLDECDGFVVKSFYNEVDGWLWCEFMVTTKEGQVAVEQGMAVSNAYIPVATRGAGVYNGVKYDRELVEGVFTHLAIVPNPRYKESIILSPADFKVYQETKQNELKQLKNSVEENKTKEEKEKTMTIKFWAKKEVENSDDVMGLSVDLEDGTSIAIEDMVKEVQNAREAEKANEEAKKKEEEKDKINMDSKVKVGEEEMTLKELVDAYASTKKKNADEEADKSKDADKAKDNEEEEKKKEEESKDKKNSEDEEQAKKDADKENEMKNSEHFEAIDKAGAEKENCAPVMNIQTASGAVELGKSRYGSSK